MIDILFFSRGRGRGHAVPDVAIADELLRRQPHLNLQFVSYDTGARTIRELGRHVIDLGLPENNPFVATMLQALRVIKEQSPTLVVSHEEFSAIPAAKYFSLPSIFITDWFPPIELPTGECVQHADEVIFLDEPGYYEEPAGVSGKIHYVGPALRALTARRSEKHAIRGALGIPETELVILVIPGGASVSSEERAPISELVLKAFDLIETPQKRLIWIANDNDLERIATAADARPNVQLMRPHVDVERTMAVADLAITKATRITTFELAALGVPSVSISHGLNPIDDYRVLQVPTNRALRARGLSPQRLKDVLMSHLANTASWSDRAALNLSQRATTRVVERLVAALERTLCATEHQSRHS